MFYPLRKNTKGTVIKFGCSNPLAKPANHFSNKKVCFPDQIDIYMISTKLKLGETLLHTVAEAADDWKLMVSKVSELMSIVAPNKQVILSGKTFGLSKQIHQDTMAPGVVYYAIKEIFGYFYSFLVEVTSEVLLP